MSKEERVFFTANMKPAKIWLKSFGQEVFKMFHCTHSPFLATFENLHHASPVSSPSLRRTVPIWVLLLICFEGKKALETNDESLLA